MCDQSAFSKAEQVNTILNSVELKQLFVQKLKLIVNKKNVSFQLIQFNQLFQFNS